MSKHEAKNSKAGEKGRGGKGQGKTIALNKAARHEYHLEDRFEAGLALQGWELKAIRAGRLGIGESYALVKNGEIFLFGAQITPLNTTSTHITAEPKRTRKLLLNKRELSRLLGSVDREGYTLVPLDLHWKGGRAKLEIGLAKGKKQHDKRASIKDREWNREQQRLLRSRR